MARQPNRPRDRRGRRGRIWPGGLRRRLVVAFVLVATVSAGALAVASYLLVRDARLDGSLAASAAEAREDLNLAANLTYQAAGDFVRAYEQRGTHAVLIFPGGRTVASDAQVNPPIPAVLQGFVRQGQLGYQRMDVGGQPYLVVAGRVPGSNDPRDTDFPNSTSCFEMMIDLVS